MQKSDNYKDPKTMQFQNTVARIFRPELTEAERAERIKAIHYAAADLIKSTQRMTGTPYKSQTLA